MVVDLYHMSHVDNIGSIMERGALYCDADRVERGIRPLEISYMDLKRRRLREKVRVPPGGVLADYVPFYFAPCSPMLYVIHKGRVEGCRQDDVVYVATTVEKVQRARLSFVYTDMHSVYRFSQHFNDPGQLHRIIDWELMGSPDWANDQERDPERKQRRQAEFLVHRQLPCELITTLAVRNAAGARRVLAALEAVDRRIGIRVRPDWYFPEGSSHDRTHGTGEPAAR